MTSKKEGNVHRPSVWRMSESRRLSASAAFIKTRAQILCIDKNYSVCLYKYVMFTNNFFRYSHAVQWDDDDTTRVGEVTLEKELRYNYKLDPMRNCIRVPYVINI